MVHTKIIPNNTDLHVVIPESYIGKEVEVIVFIKEESIETPKEQRKKPTFDAISIDTTLYKFNRDEANER